MTHQNDRELLRLAAKAAGPDVFGEPGCYFRRLPLGTVTGWNSRDDDGDALRLAVTCEMDVFIRAGRWSEAVCPMGPVCRVEHGNDANAATRLAITRAAAAKEGLK